MRKSRRSCIQDRYAAFVSKQKAGVCYISGYATDAIRTFLLLFLVLSPRRTRGKRLSRSSYPSKPFSKQPPDST
ncbi:MAG: hypothetical protein ABIT72_09635, partial [Burkholderiaceae bacterium]